MAIKCHRIPLLDVDVYFVTTVQEARDFILSHSSDEADLDGVANAVGSCPVIIDADGRNYRMMCVFDGTINTVVHEAVHMAWIVMRYCSIKVGKANEEPMAYTSAWLAETMLEVLKDS